MAPLVTRIVVEKGAKVGAPCPLQVGRSWRLQPGPEHPARRRCS